MSHLTDLGESMLAGFIRGEALDLSADWDIGCLTAAGDGSFTEASWTGYDRVPVVRSLTAWSGTQGAGTTLASTGTSHATTNNAAVDFGAVGAGASAIITHLGLFLPDSSDGELFAYAELATPLSVIEGDPVIFGAGSIVWTLGLTGGLSDYLANRLIDLIWRAQAYSMPASMWAALLTSAPTNAGGGSEAAGGSYVRVEVQDSDWSQAGGELSNTDAVVWPSPTGAWGTVTHHAFWDADTLGNLMFWGALDAPRTVTAGGAAPRFGAGQRRIIIS